MNSFQKKLQSNFGISLLLFNFTKNLYTRLEIGIFLFSLQIAAFVFARNFCPLTKDLRASRLYVFFGRPFLFWRQWTNLLKKLWQLFPSCYHFQTLHRNFLNHLVQIEHVGPKESHGMGSGSHCKNHWYRQILAILLI